MPIEEPRLDDLRYDRVREELIRRIPVHAPEWTDHNDSDPGITLIQLFAYLAEQVGYRLNRIPEKNHVELLKLLGTRLQPARAATTRLALLLDTPPTHTARPILAGATARAAAGNPPPTFETDAAVDTVPAQLALLVTTRGPSLIDLLDGVDDDEDDPTNEGGRWLAVSWDGKAPKLKDMPVEPVRVVTRAGHRYLWIGLIHNGDPKAGFRGVRVTLTVQLDDDEQPSLETTVRCGPCKSVGDALPTVDWLHYIDASGPSPTVKPIAGRIDDATEHFGRSGTIRFRVPDGIGPVPEDAWANLRDPSTMSPLDACLAMGRTLGGRLEAIDLGSVDSPGLVQMVSGLQGAVAGALAQAEAAAGEVEAVIPHPLDPRSRAPEKVTAWLRVRLPEETSIARSPRLRMLTFNSVAATHATTVRNELLGVADGTPGQVFRLRNRNVLPGTLRVAVQEDSDPSMPLVEWEVRETLDAAGPFDRAVAVDPEAGEIVTGDGRRGRIVPLVPGGGNVVALRYRHGGGLAGNVGLGAITRIETNVAGISAAVNLVAATGGREAETLADAKVRARKELSTRSRAVTASDFEFIARQTPGVRVARVAIVPRRRPLPGSASMVAVASARCGPLPTGPAGLDPGEVPGAVAVVVVPDEPDHPEPIPTPAFLRAVCRHLDPHRLVTTEVHVVPPQYLRLCNVRIDVRARPGYTRAQVQDLVEARLSTYLHVLKGGEDGLGFPFGGQVHISDLMAQVSRTEGVERVDRFEADFSRTRSNANPRQGRLVLCPRAAGEHQVISLAAEECASIDVIMFTLSTVA